MGREQQLAPASLGGGRAASSPPRRAEVKWFPLQKHPIFRLRSTPGGSTTAAGATSSSRLSDGGQSGNLATWNEDSSRLYLWDQQTARIHRLSLRFSEADTDGSSPLLEAASPSEILVPDLHIHPTVHHISLNIDGSALLLCESECVKVMNLYERISSKDNTLTYRTVSVGSGIYSSSNKGLKILQVSWHPYSSTHLGILSSDSVFRIYDLSSDFEHPEQEYYLQPLEPQGYHNASSICPVAFSFGGHHLWDRFSVFFLFSDGSVYVLCPIVPFGSLCSWKYLEGIYEDVKMFGLKSSDSKVLRNSNLAIAWLEATFPELSDRSNSTGNLLVSRAHPYASLDASLLFQGPLYRIRHAADNDDSINFEGKAVAFLYSSIGKDSVIIIAWSSGHLQVDALTDEIHPFWNFDSHPRVRLDSHDRIKGVAMICESSVQEVSTSVFGTALNEELSDSNLDDFGWLGCPPPLLRLAIVDLALPKDAMKNSLLSLFPDPIITERFYCLHDGGMDLIILHFLPFSQSTSETDKIPKPPSVYPILTSQKGSFSPSICGFAAIADSCGQSQIIGITTTYECVILETTSWKEMQPCDLNMKSSRQKESLFPDFVSQELLSGPKPIALPVSATSRPVTADSIEGRSTLHRYIKQFHYNYVQYGHKVHVVLKQHGDHVKVVMEDQHKRLNRAREMLSRVESRHEGLKERINHACLVHKNLEHRLQNLKTLPGANKKPLSRAETEFKAQLERFADLELDALQSSIDALTARLKRYTQSSQLSTPSSQRWTTGRVRNQLPDSQMPQLKSSLGLLSSLNTEMTEKLKLIQNELDGQEK